MTAFLYKLYNFKPKVKQYGKQIYQLDYKTSHVFNDTKVHIFGY